MTCLPHFGAPLVSHMVKNLPAMWETRVLFLGWKDPLEEEMATHSSILAWRIPWTEESGGLQSGVAKSKTRSEQLTLALSLGGRDRDGGLLSTFPFAFAACANLSVKGMKNVENVIPVHSHFLLSSASQEWSFWLYKLRNLISTYFPSRKYQPSRLGCPHRSGLG